MPGDARFEEIWASCAAHQSELCVLCMLSDGSLGRSRGWSLNTCIGMTERVDRWRWDTVLK